jgi:hypothetical protein
VATMAALSTDVVLIAETVSKDVDAAVTSTVEDSKVAAFEPAAFAAAITFKAAEVAFTAEQAPAAAVVAFMAEEDSMVAAEALMVAAAGKV